jgi:hypothetical protein
LNITTPTTEVSGSAVLIAAAGAYAITGQEVGIQEGRTGYVALLDVLGFRSLITGPGGAGWVSEYLGIVRYALNMSDVESVIFSDRIVLTKDGSGADSLYAICHANATPRAVRGASRRKALDPMLRTQRRGASWAMRQKVEAVAQQIANGSVFDEPERAKLVETRKAVVAGWLAVAKILDRQGETKLAADVRKFVQEMPPVMTDKERLAHQLVQSVKERITPKKPDPVRVPERTR